MRPDISEFSYGYALTEALIRSGQGLIAAPVFPSLIEEGTTGGYDVQLPFKGSALFVQFKLSDQMTQRAREVRDLGFKPPFFRFHLRPGRHSQQHNLLLVLEQSGESVFYAAPQFADRTSFNQAYLNGQMMAESVFVSPAAIGQLDDLDHHVSFERNGTLYLYSEPKKLSKGVYFGNSLWETLSTNHAETINEDFFKRLNKRLVDVVKNRSSNIQLSETDAFWAKLKGHPARAQLGFIARTFFNCEPFVIGNRPKDLL